MRGGPINIIDMVYDKHTPIQDLSTCCTITLISTPLPTNLLKVAREFALERHATFEKGIFWRKSFGPCETRKPRADL